MENILVSGHQYGAGCELCLEFRADNWSPVITGAMMIESAHRLLVEEVDDTAEPVLSAHRTTLGQEIRSSSLRLLISLSANVFLQTIAVCQPVGLTFKEHTYGGTWIAYPVRVGSKDAAEWCEAAPFDSGASENEAVAIRLPQNGLPGKITAESLHTLLLQNGMSDWTEGTKDQRSLFILLVTANELRLIWRVNTGKEPRVYEYKTVELRPVQPRLTEQYQALEQKKVGIVGCGSVGSKLAASLARTGISKFLLIDPDVFMPENVVRNELDQRAAGVNKSAALRARLQEINSKCDVNVRSLLFGGQESSASTSAAMSALAECDLLIDATASPDVFNLCAAVSRAARKPMAWGLVYGGGIGGLIARARPDIDPVPLVARNQISRWYAGRGIEWFLQERTGYDVDDAEGAPLLASDADVSVIAAHLTHLVIDTLIDSRRSIFPNSAYAIGMSAQWIFRAPFDTWPIGLTLEGQWGPETEENAPENVDAFLLELLRPKRVDDG
jgi:sulfur-carrier protein adenylyltransferase/sulfurtransferase